MNKHTEFFFERLAQYRNDKLFADFKIIVEGTTFAVHKLILTSWSDYFRNMLSMEVTETRTGEVNLQDISVETMNVILDFLYTGTLKINEDNVKNVLQAASRFQIEPVQELCVTYLVPRIELSNCLSIADISERCNIPILREKAFDYVIEKFVHLVHDDKFLELDESFMEKLLSDEQVNITETDLFVSLISWTEIDMEARMDAFDRLVNHIRFAFIDPAILITYSDGGNDVVGNSKVCLDLINRTKNYLILKNSQAHPDLIEKGFQDLKLSHRDNLMSRQRLYAIGGWSSIDNVSEKSSSISSVEMFDPIRNIWKEVRPMRESRCGLGCAVLNGSIYAVGGHDSKKYLNSVERYDMEQDRWFYDVADMKHARTSVGIVALDKYLYAIGGQMTNGATNFVERYDPETNTWIDCSPLNQKRLGAGVTVLNGFIYVVGGAEISNSTVFDSVERYDPIHDKWVYVATMTYARKHLGCTSCNGKIYSIGGKNDEELQTAEVYDPRTNTWSDLPGLKHGRHGIGVAELGGTIYVIGGQNGNSYLNDVEAFDTHENVWSSRTSMIERRLGIGVAVHPAGNC